MSKIGNLFDKLYGVAESAVKEARKPFVKKRLIMAIDTEINSHEFTVLNLEEREKELFNEIINEKSDAVKAFKEFASNRIKIKDTRETIHELNDIRKELFGEANEK